MEANLNPTLRELKQQIQYLPTGDRWALFQWLVELLQPDSQHSEQNNQTVNLEAVQEICDRIRSLPVLDPRSPDEIIGYNQFGGLD